MSEEIDRTAYCERVEISSSTLSRWIAEGVVRPERVGPDGHQVFTEIDVKFGRGLIIMLSKYPGRYRLKDMVEVVHGNKVLDPYAAP